MGNAIINCSICTKNEEESIQHSKKHNTKKKNLNYTAIKNHKIISKMNLESNLCSF